MMDDIREQLLGRDYLYNDASAYRAGVEAALTALAAQTHNPGRITHPDQSTDDRRGVAVANHG